MALDAIAPADAVQDAVAADQETAAATQQDEATSADEVEGSGGGDIPAILPPPASGFFSLPTFPSFSSFFTRGFFGGGAAPPVAGAAVRRRARFDAAAFYEQRSNYDDDDDDARESFREGRQYFSECTDRITLPCVVEDFIAAGMGNVPNCLPIHCGDSLCDYGVAACKIESTVKPFGIGVHFGQGEEKGSPEENIGACLKYNQVSCA